MDTRETQLLLLFLGYDLGTADGVLGQQTKEAVKQFQKDYGCRFVDGIPGQETDAALRKAVGSGWKRPAVKQTAVQSAAVQNTAASGAWVSKYFRREEFRCQCGGKYCNGFPHEPTPALQRLLDAVREQAGMPGYISSGVRCDTHNAAVGGVKTSRHRLGQAADVKFQGMTPDEMVKAAYANGATYAYSILSGGKPTGYVHMDTVK